MTDQITAQSLEQQIKTLREAGFIVSRPKYSARYLKRFNFQAKTIVDVGVCHGTEPLYSTFPDRKFVLVEPLPGSEQQTRKRFPHLNIDFYACAAGAAGGEGEFLIDSDTRWFSGFFPRMDKTAASKRLKIKIERLDTILSTQSYDRPFGVKIDVEGFELQVIEGLGKLISDVEFFIIESQIKLVFPKKDRFSDLVAMLKEARFELADILNVVGHQPIAHDYLFLREDDVRFRV